MPPDIETPVADESVSVGGGSDVSSQPSSSGSSGSSSSDAGGFSTPYEAFRELPEFNGKEDIDIARELYRSHTGVAESKRQLSQYQNLLPATQDYLRNEQQFRAWQKSQAEAARPAPPETPKWWNPPQVKETWRNFIVRDPQSGKEMIAPDAPYEAQQAIREYQTYTADFARRLVTDPENTLKPFIEQVAQQKAQELVQGQFSQYATTNYVSDLEKQNADWLYDSAGGVTPEGAAIQRYIADAANLGISSPDARWKYATSMLRSDLQNVRYAQTQQAFATQTPPSVGQQTQAPPSQVADANMQFLRERATRTPNRSAGIADQSAASGRQSFSDRLLDQLKRDGVI
jgi:hypothetical protein